MTCIGGLHIPKTGSVILTAKEVKEVEDHIDQLEAENAKLRELVVRVDRARRDLCDAYPDAELLNCEQCPAWSACRGDLMDRMRELGVEVDDGQA